MENRLLHFHCKKLQRRSFALVIIWYHVFMSFGNDVSNYRILFYNSESGVKGLWMLISLRGYSQVWLRTINCLLLILSQRNKGRKYDSIKGKRKALKILFLHLQSETLWERSCDLVIHCYHVFMNFRTDVSNQCILLYNRECVVKSIWLLI